MTSVLKKQGITNVAIFNIRPVVPGNFCPFGKFYLRTTPTVKTTIMMSYMYHPEFSSPIHTLTELHRRTPHVSTALRNV